MMRLPALDEMIGEVVGKLESQGIGRNTLIMFMADNGRPYARDKATLYDSGIKTPLIVYWPRTRCPRRGERWHRQCGRHCTDVSGTRGAASIPGSIEGRSFVELPGGARQDVSRFRGVRTEFGTISKITGARSEPSGSGTYATTITIFLRRPVATPFITARGGSW